MPFPVLAAQLISSNDQQTVIGLLATALGILVVALARVVQVWLNTRGKLVAVKGEARAATIKLDESKEEAALKNLQLVQQQVDDQRQQIVRLQQREAARDTTDKVLTDLVAQVGEIKITYAQGMQTWATQMQTFNDVLQAGNEKRTDRIVDELGKAVKEVNSNSKTLFDRLLEEIKAMGERLEKAINNKTDPTIIATTLKEDMLRLETEVKNLRTEQAETIRLAVIDALSKANTPPTQAPNAEPEPKDKPKEDKT